MAEITNNRYVCFISSGVFTIVVLLLLMQNYLLGRDSYIWKTNGGLSHTKVADAIGFEIGKQYSFRKIKGCYYYFFKAFLYILWHNLSW